MSLNYPFCRKTCNRRQFLGSAGSVGLGSVMLPGMIRDLLASEADRIKPCGPAVQYSPKLKVTFVRREQDYGMRWPGQIYDGEAALKKYEKQIRETAKELNIKVDIRSQPIYSLEAGEQWLNQAKAEQADGLMVVLLDRQEHAWPTANRAIDSGIPTIVFSPLGSSFTTNTARPSKKEGVFICSTDDFSQPAFGMKMIKAGSKLREMRFLVLWSDQKRNAEIPFIGTKLRYLPAVEFANVYKKLSDDRRVKQLGDELIVKSRVLDGPTRQDVYNGIKSYLVAKQLLEQESCDGITMDCLGALGNTDISLPCIAWSRMNDHGIPAACEADLGACVSHALVQFLFDRPGFQQDPVAETVHQCVIGSHCSCATKLNGFDQTAEPYDIVPHHGKRDATARPVWKVGQRVSVADIRLSPKGVIRAAADVGKKEDLIMYISAGTVVENKMIPPSGGCVVAPMVKLDNVDHVLDYPGFHQIFFYGDYKQELRDYCQLYGIKPVVV